MRRLFSLLIFLTIVVAAFMSLAPDGERQPGNVEGLPWQIEVLPAGRARVFGITLGRDTLGEARQRLGDDMEIAIVVAPGQDTGGLEMFYSRFEAGVFTGKLVLAADLDAGVLAQMMARSVKSSHMKTGARKISLHPDDLPRAFQAPLATITFIPAVSIDEDSAIRRFGKPVEIVRIDEQVAHLLYPDKGLDLIIDTEGPEVLQYVAPRDFDRLRTPLMSTSVKAG